MHRRDVIQGTAAALLAAGVGGRAAKAQAAGDPIRKLAPDDRMTGCARMCLEQGIVPSWLLFGMAAAFRFQPAGDASAAGLQAEMSAEGLCAVLAKRCGILPEERLSSVVCEADSIVGVDNALTAGIAWCEGLKRTWGGPDAGAA